MSTTPTPTAAPVPSTERRGNRVFVEDLTPAKVPRGCCIPHDYPPERKFGWSLKFGKTVGCPDCAHYVNVILRTNFGRDGVDFSKKIGDFFNIMWNLVHGLNSKRRHAKQLSAAAAAWKACSLTISEWEVLPLPYLYDYSRAILFLPRGHSPQTGNSAVSSHSTEVVDPDSVPVTHNPQNESPLGEVVDPDPVSVSHSPQTEPPLIEVSGPDSISASAEYLTPLDALTAMAESSSPHVCRQASVDVPPSPTASISAASEVTYYTARTTAADSLVMTPTAASFEASPVDDLAIAASTPVPFTTAEAVTETAEVEVAETASKEHCRSASSAPDYRFSIASDSTALDLTSVPAAAADTDNCILPTHAVDAETAVATAHSEATTADVNDPEPLASITHLASKEVATVTSELSPIVEEQAPEVTKAESVTNGPSAHEQTRGAPLRPSLLGKS